MKQRVLEYIGKDRPIESESVSEQLRERDSNLARGLRVFRDVRKWIVFDFETTGFGQEDKIIEVAFQRFRMENNQVVEGEDYHTLVDPERWILGPVQELTGITPGNV